MKTKNINHQFQIWTKQMVMILNFCRGTYSVFTLINNTRCMLASLKLTQTSCLQVRGKILNLNVTEKRCTYQYCTHYETCYNSVKFCQLIKISANRRVAKLFKKATLTNMESRNTEILWFIPSILHHYTHTQKNARMKYYTVMTAICLTLK